MSSSYSRVQVDNAASDRSRRQPVDLDPVESPIGHRVDSNAVRWVLAATVAFWLAVYAAGRSFF